MNWTTLYAKYKSQWVALKADEKTVVGSGKTARAALSQAQKKGYEHPILMRVPNGVATYVGLSQ